MDSVFLQKLLHEIIALDLGTDLFFFFNRNCFRDNTLELGESLEFFLKKFLLL